MMITIDFSTLGIETDAASEFFRLVWSSVSRWWSYRRDKGELDGPFTCYAVHEHPEGGPRHVHWVMYVPESTKPILEAAVRRRIEKLSKLDCLGRALHFRDVEKPGGIAKYVLKGISPPYGSHFYIDPHDQGFISGRRITISRGIGFAARNRAGWRRKRRGQ